MFDRLGRYLKFFVSTVIPFSHAFASQFGKANLFRRKTKKTNAKTECSVDRQVAPYDHWHGHCGVYCEQNGDMFKHWVSMGPTTSQSTCHGDDNHWADIYEEEIMQLYSG